MEITLSLIAFIFYAISIFMLVSSFYAMCYRCERIEEMIEEMHKKMLPEEWEDDYPIGGGWHV